MRVNRSAPTATVVPILVYPDVGQAVDWLCHTFGFSERLRLARDGVIGHAQLAVGEGAIMLGRQGGPFRSPVPQGDEVSSYVHISVEDVDQHFAHTKACGARILKEPVTMPFGERQYTVVDPAGHWWTFSQHVADLAPEEWGAVSAPAPKA